MAATATVPFGLTHQVRRAPHLASGIDITYDQARQLNRLPDGRSLAEDPDLMAAVTLSWETADS